MSAELEQNHSLVRASEYGLGTTDFIVRYGLLWGGEDVGREVWLELNTARALDAANKHLGVISTQMVKRFGSFREPLAFVAMAGVRTAQQQQELTRLSRIQPVSPSSESDVFYEISETEQARQKLWNNVRLTGCARNDWHTKLNVVDIGVVSAKSEQWMDTSLCYSSMGNLLLNGNTQNTPHSLAAGSLAVWVLKKHGFTHNPNYNHWHWELDD